MFSIKLSYFDSFLIICSLLLFSKVTCFASLCPSPEDIKPCECKSNSIECHNIWNHFDLENISKRLDLERSNTSFAEFSLYNTSIEKIGDIFKSVAFKLISISNNKNLTDISAKAFSGSEVSLDILSISGNVRLSNAAPNEHHIFDASTQFLNVRYILLPHNGLTSIPIHVFHSNHTPLRELTYLNLRENNITQIESQTFVGLEKLSSINLGQNKINSIAKSAFVLSQDIKSASISMDFNRLNSSSFESHWIDGSSNASILFELSHNNITYLDQHIFEDILSPKYNIGLTLSNNPFKCDCRTKWLITNKNSLKSKVHGIDCEDKKYIWLKTEDDFKSCSSK